MAGPTPAPANYLTDLLVPLVVLGAALTIVFIITTNQAVAEVEPDDKGLASGIFETSNHLLGGAVGVAVYATIMASVASEKNPSAGYRAAFFAGAVMVVALGAAAITQSNSKKRLKQSLPARGQGQLHQCGGAR